MIKERRAFICGIKGLKLSKKEILFIKKYKPWGIILFSRNIQSIKQARNLTSSIKRIYGNMNYPILIDEEGGRVSRLSSLIENKSLNSEYYGKLYKKNYKKFLLYYGVHIKQICYLLKELGININTVPVLDLKRYGSKNIIGDRSFSKNPKVVSKIGNICINLYKKYKICNVIKHIPGHGISKIDSHFRLPIAKVKHQHLVKNDFKSFRKKKALFAMTAHIAYPHIDGLNPATLSNKLINIIRKNIGFQNLIITDDISMKSLNKNIKFNTRKAFIAGCNLVLHCNAKMREMKIVAKNSPFISEFIKKKTKEFENTIR
tara:strand:+ start:1334 stop:2284 length:951 start_codon:yes stop_codon:yes gene_type:complete